MISTPGPRLEVKPTGRVAPSRRRVLGLLAAAAGLASGCEDGARSAPATSPPSPAPSTPATAAPADSDCVSTPSETKGPFPTIGEFIRSDVRGGRDGTALDLTITVVSSADDCSPVSGVEVSIWQCDADGDYSQYGSEQNESFLRGALTTDAEGKVRFITVYPGWYQGRATHIHVEASLEGRTLGTSQIAFPDDVSAVVHATGAYARRGRNPTTNERDGVSLQLAAVVGDPTAGYRGDFRFAVRA